MLYLVTMVEDWFGCQVEQERQFNPLKVRKLIARRQFTTLKNHIDSTVEKLLRQLVTRSLQGKELQTNSTLGYMVTKWQTI